MIEIFLWGLFVVWFLGWIGCTFIFMGLGRASGWKDTFFCVGLGFVWPFLVLYQWWCDIFINPKIDAENEKMRKEHLRKIMKEDGINLDDS